VHADIKVSSTPDYRGVVYVLGIVDVYTSRAWLKPLANRTSAEVIRAFQEWAVQDIKNAAVGDLRLDNDTCFTSAAFTQFAHEYRLPVSFSEAYFQNQNGPAEHFFCRMMPLTILNIHTAPHLGKERWVDAAMHATHTLNCRPTSDGRGTPLERATGKKIDLAHLRPFGAVGYVHENVHSGFQLRARKAVLLHYAPNHATGVYAMLMLDTRRIKYTASVTWVDHHVSEPDKHADTARFDLTTPEHAPLVLHKATAHSPLPVNLAPPPVQQLTITTTPTPAPTQGDSPPTPPLGTATQQHAPMAGEFYLHQRITLGDLSRSKAAYIRARVQALRGRTVEMALASRYVDSTGKSRP